jgi:hypothetical protein
MAMRLVIGKDVARQSAPKGIPFGAVRDSKFAPLKPAENRHFKSAISVGVLGHPTERDWRHF